MKYGVYSSHTSIWKERIAFEVMAILGVALIFVGFTLRYSKDEVIFVASLIMRVVGAILVGVYLLGRA